MVSMGQSGLAPRPISSHDKAVKVPSSNAPQMRLSDTLHCREEIRDRRLLYTVDFRAMRVAWTGQVGEVLTAGLEPIPKLLPGGSSPLGSTWCRRHRRVLAMR